MRSGDIDIHDAMFYEPGLYGYYWSSRADVNLVFGDPNFSNGIDPSFSGANYTGGRNFGFPLRCLAS